MKMKMTPTRIAAVAVKAVGLVAAFFIARDIWVILGLALAFVLLALFIWSMETRSRRRLITLAFVIWGVGALAGFLVGYRPYRTAGPEPWRWIPAGNAWPAVMVEAHMDWPPAIIVWSVMALLGAAALVIALTKRPKSDIS